MSHGSSRAASVLVVVVLLAVYGAKSEELELRAWSRPDVESAADLLAGDLGRLESEASSRAPSDPNETASLARMRNALADAVDRLDELSAQLRLGLGRDKTRAAFRRLQERKAAFISIGMRTRQPLISAEDIESLSARWDELASYYRHR